MPSLYTRHGWSSRCNIFWVCFCVNFEFTMDFFLFSACWRWRHRRPKTSFQPSVLREVDKTQQKLKPEWPLKNFCQQTVHEILYPMKHKANQPVQCANPTVSMFLQELTRLPGVDGHRFCCWRKQCIWIKAITKIAFWFCLMLLTQHFNRLMFLT